MVPAFLAAIPRSVWKPLAGVAIGALVVIALLLMYRSAIDRAHEAGRQEAFDESRMASQVVADSWRARVDASDAARVEAESRGDTVIERNTHEIKEFYRDRPAAAAVACLPTDRVQQAQAARDGVLSASTSASGAAVPVAKATDTADR